MIIDEGEFVSGELVVCYAPPNLQSVMAGNQVMLRSGGPKMIVSRVYDNNIAVCRWGSGEFEVGNFDLKTLTCYGAK